MIVAYSSQNMSVLFGKDTVSIGSAPNNDIVLQGPGVAPVHAQIVKQQGQLLFVNVGAGQCFVNGSPLAPNQPVPFDFRTQFAVGQVPVPLSSPAIVAMIMSPGQAQVPRGQLILGRDVARSSLAIAHPAISGLHATIALDRMMVIDHGSTSGTYVSGQRCPPEQPIPLDPNGILALGPVPVSVALLMQFLGLPSPSGPPPAGNLAQGGSGHPRPAPAQSPAISPPAEGAPARKHRTVIGELSMDQLASAITIGRTPDNQIVVPHPQVSSKHAVIIKQGEQLFLEDKGSANGTFVRHQRVTPGQRIPISNGEKVFIGPMPVIIQIAGARLNVVVEDQQQNWAGKPLYEIEAWDLFLEVPDRDQKGQMKTLLDRVSFKALPGDMIALMGPSGAGKTTLLMTLNGYLPPSGGQVRINGEDLYAIYDALRGSIGYVPQDDIVHPELTVFEAVKYSARFRLPPDYSEDEIDRRVTETLKDLGLEAVMNLQIGKPEKKVLSGGQRKRVNIALELVTDPVILFLDEPTSGLAADDTTALINLLSDLAKRTGKTIIMTIHQPARDEYEKFNVAFIMGYGGIPLYFGPTGNASYEFFGRIQPARTVDNPRDMFDMLNARERGVLEQMKAHNPNTPRGIARLEAARQWRVEFFNPNNPVFQQMFSGRRAVGQQQAQRGSPGRPDVALFRQLTLLFSRYTKIKMRDRAGAAIMFLQAPIIGILLAIVFGGQKPSVPFWCIGALQELSTKTNQASEHSQNLLASMSATKDNTVAMFFVVVSCIFFGTSNSAREIVTERSIYLRERMVNLSLLNYVFSKYVFLSLVCIIQCSMLLGIVFFALGFEGGPLAFGAELANLIALAMNATAVGLLISTFVTSAEAAMALTPIALIPQIVLGGIMVPMTSTTNPIIKYLMYVMPSRWGLQGTTAHERAAITGDKAWNVDLHNPGLTSLPDFIQNGKFECARAQIESDTLVGAWGFTDWQSYWLPPVVLFGMTVVMVVFLLIILKRRDPV